MTLSFGFSLRGKEFLYQIHTRSLTNESAGPNPNGINRQGFQGAISDLKKEGKP
jgi:hypothetical protein